MLEKLKKKINFKKEDIPSLPSDMENMRFDFINNLSFSENGKPNLILSDPINNTSHQSSISIAAKEMKKISSKQVNTKTYRILRQGIHLQFLFSSLQ